MSTRSRDDVKRMSFSPGDLWMRRWLKNCVFGAYWQKPKNATREKDKITMCREYAEGIARVVQAKQTLPILVFKQNKHCPYLFSRKTNTAHTCFQRARTRTSLYTKPIFYTHMYTHIYIHIWVHTRRSRNSLFSVCSGSSCRARKSPRSGRTGKAFSTYCTLQKCKGR